MYDYNLSNTLIPPYAQKKFSSLFIIQICFSSISTLTLFLFLKLLKC